MAQSLPSLPDPDHGFCLESALCDLQRPARAYMYTWTSVLAALLATQVVLASTTGGADEKHRAARAGYIVGATMSGLAIPLVLSARSEAYGCDRVLNLPDGTEAERRERRRAVEQALLAASRATRRQTAWWMHGVGVALGLGVGLGLGLGYRHNNFRSVAQGVGTFAFTELRIWTRSRRSIVFAQGLQNAAMGPFVSL